MSREICAACECAVPTGIARSASGGTSVAAGRSLARARLARLATWLDRQLDEAPRVFERDGVRVVSVFESVAYRIDSRQRSVCPVLWRDGRITGEQPYDVDLGNLLRTPAALTWALEDLGLAASAPQLSVFESAHQARAHDAWLRAAAYATLCRDPRFARLRGRVLPDALQLDAQVRKLALLARPLPRRMDLPARLYSTVWKHREAFACAGWEIPQLLPLLYLGIAQGQIEQKRDPVGELKALVRAAGVGEAAWRYVVRHGARIFRCAWRCAAGGPALGAAIEYLRVLQDAGLPPAPPPCVAQAWLGSIGAQVRFASGWNDVPADVLRIAFREARARAAARADPRELARFVEQFARVARWAAAEVTALDKLQRRAGWVRLERRALEWAEDMRWLETQETRRWPVALASTRIGPYRALAVADSAALLEEGQCMHHCASAYADQCMEGAVRIYSLRDAIGGERVASVGLRRAKSGAWAAFDVRRRLNRCAEARLWHAAAQLARRYAEAEG